MKILVICGCKNTGKTTMMSFLIHELSKKGYKVGTIKHDGHEFDSDIEGRDSTIHYQSGARQSAVFSQNRWMMIEDQSMSLENIISYFQDNDILLIEGCKESHYPKIEMLRKGYQETPVSLKDNRLAVISDFDLKCDEKVLDIDDKNQILEFVENYIKDY